MESKVAILRGINVGGKRKILMVDLRTICEKLGFKDVKTYIQSGNVVFKSEKDSAYLEDSLEKTIKKEYGFDVPVIVRSLDELKNSVNNNPFYKANIDISHLYLTFLKTKADDEKIKLVNETKCEPDKFVIINKDIYIYCEGKYHKSKLTNNFYEKKLKVGATTRNWKTVLKLLELSE